MSNIVQMKVLLEENLHHWRWQCCRLVFRHWYTYWKNTSPESTPSCEKSTMIWCTPCSWSEVLNLQILASSIKWLTGQACLSVHVRFSCPGWSFVKPLLTGLLHWRLNGKQFRWCYNWDCLVVSRRSLFTKASFPNYHDHNSHVSLKQSENRA